ncbi:hypothetical protein Sjap_004362 [Stephania japonica]|uniref:Uncharacterized protein n=1 Tax=Stephania japonica TaxID=461633 RepID=A0AAP0PJ04_9MAGN
MEPLAFRKLLSKTCVRRSGEEKGNLVKSISDYKSPRNPFLGSLDLTCPLDPLAALETLESKTIDGDGIARTEDLESAEMRSREGAANRCQGSSSSPPSSLLNRFYQDIRCQSHQKFEGASGLMHDYDLGVNEKSSKEVILRNEDCKSAPFKHEISAKDRNYKSMIGSEVLNVLLLSHTTRFSRSSSSASTIANGLSLCPFWEILEILAQVLLQQKENRKDDQNLLLTAAIRYELWKSNLRSMMECDMKAKSIGTKRKYEVLDTCLQR